MELAMTGHYSGWRAIEVTLRQFRPSIRTALAGHEAQSLVDRVCRDCWQPSQARSTQRGQDDVM